MSLRGALCAVSVVVACASACHGSDGERLEGHELDVAPAPVLGVADDGSAIIYFAREVDVPARAAAGRAGRRALIEALQEDAASARARTLELLGRSGIEPRSVLWMINAIAVTLPDALVDEIAELPEVDHIGPDLRVAIASQQAMEASPPVPRAEDGAPWNLAAMAAPELWAKGVRGAGTVVAVLDTGVDREHPDLARSWRSASGWYDPYGEHAQPFDAAGHGTQVAGLAVGGDASGEPIGVAPAAQWIAAKLFDDAGTVSLSAIHLALQWVLDPDGVPATDDAPDVVTGSWGYAELVDQCYLELEQDLTVLRAAQIANVFAAGNSGPYAASSMSPANNPSAFAAGAVDEGLAVLPSSARGPDACTGSIFPELVAPGANVRTADRTLDGTFPSSYVVVSGTSFAAPHIAGAMALLRGAHPTATVRQLELALTATATDLTALGADQDSGFGLPDLIAAEARLANLVAVPSCSDADADQYFAEPGCGSPVDCNDANAAIHPRACERPADGLDQDCDGSDTLEARSCDG